MKNLYLLFLISLPYFLGAQEYQATTNPYHQWKVYFEPSIMVAPECMNLNLNYKYSIGNEVSINGMAYRELLRTYDESSMENLTIIENYCPEEFILHSNLIGLTAIIGYLRDDVENKKVYFFRYNGTQEYILYDFSYAPGTYNFGDEILYVTNNVNVYGINTVRQGYYYWGEPYKIVFESIGDVADLLGGWYLGTGIEGGGYKLLGFSTDNGQTFYDRENNLLASSDFTLNNSVKIYPNPVKDFLHLQTDKKINNIVIYDLNGKKVKEFMSSNKINIKDLRPATYIITLEFEDGSFHKDKIIKN